MFETIRRWYKVIFAVDSVIALARLLGTIVVGTIVVIIMLVRRDYDHMTSPLVEVLLAIGVLSFAAWVYHDVNKSIRTVRKRRNERAARDRSDARNQDVARRFV